MMMRSVTFLLVLCSAFVVGILADDTMEEKSTEYLNNLRIRLGVYKFTGPDFPATFAIVGGVSLALTLAVVFIVAGLLSMEPNKDSIIYRMTTTRMKKD